MPILGLKLDNILCFNNFDINFSYPKKLSTSIIENEYLLNVPSFRYKKINIIVGSNASGKTSLLKCIWHIFIFLSNKEKKTLYSLMDDANGDSYVEIDFTSQVNDKDYLYRVRIKANKQDDKIDVAYKQISLSKGDSYENLIDELNDAKYVFKDYIECLETFDANLGWNIILPATEEMFETVRFCKVEKNNEDEYLSIMNSVFKTLDPAIVNVYRSKDSDDAYVLEHEIVGKIIVQEGINISNLPKISSGTKYGFNIANIIYSIKKGMNGIYLIDEQFSYLNSDIEKAFLATIAVLLNSDEQVFITTHNQEILDIKFPFHSFYFMSKKKYGDNIEINCNCASEIENRNNVNPRTIIDNDYFGSSPNVSKINKISEIYG